MTFAWGLFWGFIGGLAFAECVSQLMAVVRRNEEAARLKEQADRVVFRTDHRYPYDESCPACNVNNQRTE